MEIRNANEKDIPSILRLLSQVNKIHHDGRPDIFKLGTKYGAKELESIISDKDTPVLVADDGRNVVGYAFCIIRQHVGDSILTDIKTLYVDDLCVDESRRGMHIGRTLYEAAQSLAREKGCHNITLNVWQLNTDAAKFYEAMGMHPLKTCMEEILE